jgi:hypothetical protein
MSSSTKSVVSNIAPTVVGFIRTLGLFDQAINHVYHESLDYAEALKKWRSENAARPELNTFPLVIYKRSPLRHSEHGVGRRMVTQNVVDLSGSSSEPAPTFRSMLGVLDVDFVFVHPDANELENFEISYMTETGQQKEKKFSYQVPGVGTLEFFTKYELLEGIQVSIDQNHYMALSGRVSIRGFYFVATGQTPRIRQIQLALKSFETGQSLTSAQNLDTITVP